MFHVKRCQVVQGGRGILETKTKLSQYELLNRYRIILFSSVCNLNSTTSLKLKILKVGIHGIIFITIFKTRKKNERHYLIQRFHFTDEGNKALEV